MNHPDQNPAHLTAEQFGELVERGTLAPVGTEVESHLAACTQCRTELTSMREALALFCESTSAFAERELARTPRVEATRFSPIHRVFSPGLAWAAAGLLVVAAGLPLGLRHKAPVAAVTGHAASATAPAEPSDEALLEDINREVSASVPAPMQALEDPTASASGTGNDAQTSSTRKN